MNIGYVGLGAMGGALARCLMNTYQIQVYDLNRDLVDGFVADGAQAASNCKELARACDVVLTCLPRSANVHSAIFGTNGLFEGLAPGKIIIDQTTGDPAQTRAMSDLLAEKNITLVDAPVSGGPRGAAAGTLAIMAGGPAEVLETIMPILQAISPKVFTCGAVGNGQVMKLINNTLSAVCRLGTLEAVAMGRKYGVDLDVLTRVLGQSSGRSRTTEIMLPLLVDGKRSSSFAMALMLKDLTLATNLAQNSATPMPITNTARSLLQTGCNLFGSAATMDETVTLVETMADVTLTDQVERS